VESQVLLFILSVILALMLGIQSQQHRKTVNVLLSRILESQGLEGIPEDSPMAEMLQNFGAKKKSEERAPKKEVERTRFQIPGMPIFKGK